MLDHLRRRGGEEERTRTYTHNHTITHTITHTQSHTITHIHTHMHTRAHAHRHPGPNFRIIACHVFLELGLDGSSPGLGVGFGSSSLAIATSYDFVRFEFARAKYSAMPKPTHFAHFQWCPLQKALPERPGNATPRGHSKKYHALREALHFQDCPGRATPRGRYCASRTAHSLKEVLHLLRCASWPQPRKAHNSASRSAATSAKRWHIFFFFFFLDR